MSVIEARMLDLPWAEFKSVVDAKAMNIQYVQTSTMYWIKAYNGLFTIACGVEISDPAGVGQADFEANYKATGNGKMVSATEGRFERDDIRLQIARSSADIVAGAANISFKLPGNAGVDTIFLAGGCGMSDAFKHGDAVTAISVVDHDNLMGQGAGFVLATYHHAGVPEANRGWYMWPSSQVGGEIEIESLGFYGQIFAGLYLDLTFKMAAGSTATKIFCDFEMGSLI
jgi:hypothetical protein